MRLAVSVRHDTSVPAFVVKRGLAAATNLLSLFLVRATLTFFALHVNEQRERIANRDRAGRAGAGDAEAASDFHLTLRRIDREYNGTACVHSAHCAGSGGERERSGLGNQAAAVVTITM